MAPVEGFNMRGAGRPDGAMTENWNCPERCIHGAQCELDGEHNYHTTYHCPEFGSTNFRGGIWPKASESA